MLPFAEARARVVETISTSRTLPDPETVDLASAHARVLACPAAADRDYPPCDRSVRDGFAIRAADVPGELRVTGEVRAGERAEVRVGPGEAIEIMTGAVVPEGADCIVMVEHVERRDGNVLIPRSAVAGQFISRRGEEARGGQALLPAGKRLSFTDIALLAATGKSRIAVYPQPKVAILPTGDELVAVTETPLDHQVRNSNSHSLAAQVARAGGIPQILPVARDHETETRALIERGLTSDLLLLSGGVSAGKYDIVERVLADLGAEFFFDRVAIQPGQPLVFGRARGTFFFGLPGNPASTMVTFELFARAALDLLGGQLESHLPLVLGRLTLDFRHKTGLTRFLPAVVSGMGDLTPVAWKGSGDVPAMCRANAFLVAAADQPEWRAGDTMPVLMK